MDNRFVRNVILKGLVLFILADLLCVFISPSTLGKITLYNRLFSGRPRFPFGEDPASSYNLSLFNLEAMFTSHEIDGLAGENGFYDVVLIGDSSTWGTLLHPEDTLAGLLNISAASMCGKTLRVFNLGYPTISLMKDLMVLERAMRYQPDLIIWLTTLEAFPKDTQLSSPIVANNSGIVKDLILNYELELDVNDPELIAPSFWDRTLIGQRRALADLFRLQVYGFMWNATGIDQTYPLDYKPAQVDFDTDISYHNLTPPTLDVSLLALDVLEAGYRIAGETPIILVNEPMLISVGENSSLRYNFLYPRWVYDQWRKLMTAYTEQHDWQYIDLWNSVPAYQFTNSAIHLTPAGEKILADRVKESILLQSCR